MDNLSAFLAILHRCTSKISTKKWIYKGRGGGGGGLYKCILNRGIVRSGNCPVGELSGRGIVRSGNCPVIGRYIQSRLNIQVGIYKVG